MPGRDDYSPYVLHEDRIARIEDNVARLVSNLTAGMARVESKLEALEEVKDEVRGAAGNIASIQVSLANNESRLVAVELVLAEQKENRRLIRKTVIGAVSALVIAAILTVLGLHGAGGG